MHPIFNRAFMRPAYSPNYAIFMYVCVWALIVQEFYLSTSTTDVATAWNEIREVILKEAVASHLLPELKRELVRRL